MAVASRNPIADEIYYNDAAREYMARLPLEHFMESPETGTQRRITLASFDLIQAARPDVHCFNELLIQYPAGDIRAIQRVVPDNLIVVADGRIRATISFNTPFEKCRPLMAMEYVSEGNARKDYVDNMRRYQDDLKIPYYLLFEPHKRELVVFKLGPRKKEYVSVKPNRHDRLDVPELELELGMIDDWVRFWFRGELLPLSAELAAELRAARRQLEAANIEIARLKAELEQFRGP